MRNRKANTLDTIDNRFSPSNDYFHIPLHEQTGDDISIVGQLDGTAFSETATLAATPADTTWTNHSGWFEPDGTCYAFLEAVTQVASIMTPGNYPNGGLLFLCNVWLDSGRTPNSEAMTLLQYGAREHTNGGYMLELNNGANVNFYSQQYAVGAGSATNGSKAISALEDQTIPAHAFYNFNTRNACIAGVTSSLADSATWDFGSEALLTAVPATFDIGLCCRVNTTPVAANILNGTANINYNIHDLWCIAFDTEPTTAKIQEILTEFVAHPYEKLTSIP